MFNPPPCIGYKCCPHWDHVHWPLPESIPQRSRSHTRSNNLYSPIFPFLTNGSVQFWSSSTYQSGWEIKQNVYKKTMAGDIAILWTALFYFETIGQLQNPLHYKTWPLCQTTESSQPFWLCHSFYYSRDISPVNTLG